MAIRYPKGFVADHDPEYQSWKAMRSRCNNPNAAGYESYGGRGITICERWDRFDVFVADLGRRPTHRHTLERLDFDGDYEPDNCEWALPKEQQNNRRNTRPLIERIWAQRSALFPESDRRWQPVNPSRLYLVPKPARFRGYHWHAPVPSLDGFWEAAKYPIPDCDPVSTYDMSGGDPDFWLTVS